MDNTIPRKYSELYYISCYNDIDCDFTLNIHSASTVSRAELEDDRTVVYGVVSSWKGTLKSLIKLSKCRNSSTITPNDFTLTVHPSVVELFRKSPLSYLISCSFSVRK